MVVIVIIVLVIARPTDEEFLFFPVDPSGASGSWYM